MLRGMTPQERRKLFEIMGINHVVGQLGKSSYQYGQELGEGRPGCCWARVAIRHSSS